MSPSSAITKGYRREARRKRKNVSPPQCLLPLFPSYGSLFDSGCLPQVMVNVDGQAPESPRRYAPGTPVNDRLDQVSPWHTCELSPRLG